MRKAIRTTTTPQNTLNPPAAALPAGNSPDSALIAACDEIVALEHHMWQELPARFTPEQHLEQRKAQIPHEKRQNLLLGQVAEMDATTLAGIRAKAKALVAWAPDMARGDGGYDAQLLASLLNDLKGDVA